MQKRLLCYIAFFLISSVGFAQKEEFKSHCQALTALMQGKNPFHVQYSITVHGKTQADGKAEEGTMKMELYKSGTNQEIKMGDLQEVLHRDKLTCVVNHEQRSILLQRDTSYKGDNSILKPILSSSQPITMGFSNGLITLKYASYAPVTVASFDATANGYKPQALKLYFWTNSSNYDRIIDLEDFHYQFK